MEGEGEAFFTQTDSEVVLVAWLAWGIACLDRFIGMFALAIWQGNDFLLARDRLGEKPLYYSMAKASFAFASEVKAIRGLVGDLVPLCEELEFYFDAHTPFRDVFSVKPGEWVRYCTDSGRLNRRTWWSPPEPRPSVGDEHAATREFLELFSDACSIRTQAAVPSTLFLSGGIDSALIQAISNFAVTYTVQFAEFESTINERELVAELAGARKFEARVISPTVNDLRRCFTALARSMEVPVGSLSAFPLFMLAQRARADGFVVALSGEGADELFNGYYRHEVLLGEAVATERPYASLHERYLGTGLERFCRMASREGLAGAARLLPVMEAVWSTDRTLAQNISRAELSIFLQPLLRMSDQASMANSVEMRSPFLDHRIVEFAARLEDGLKFRDGRGKWLLRRALRELVGDLGVTRRLVKHGLPSPVNQWMFGGALFSRREWNAALRVETERGLGVLPARGVA